MFPVSVFSSAVIYILIVTSTVLMIVKTLNQNHQLNWWFNHAYSADNEKVFHITRFQCGKLF